MTMIVTFVAFLVAAQASPQNAWERADLATVRLAPSAFPELPQAIRQDLDKRGCRIPQAADVWKKKPHNVIRGAFTGAGRNDWAVLCSAQLRSEIVVYRGATGVVFETLGWLADETFLQNIGGGIAFSRVISVATPATIRRDAKSYGKSAPRVLDHAGIDDAFMGKASSVHYFYQGKWLTLQGSD